ncbi:MAG: fibronectin type III domain-containing protein [Chloroflexi bacterium]|nr:fibronectin type III domain-containing protein [Chloroflexota bacterium]
MTLSRFSRCQAAPLRLWAVALAVPFVLLAMAFPIWGAPAPAALSPDTDTWSSFAPSGWALSTSVTCSVKVVDTQGVQPATAEFRYSTNGGGAWSPWQGAAASASGPNTAYITASAVSLVESGALNRVEFRVLDGSGVTDTSAAYNVSVDATPPANPTVLTSTSHVVLTYSADNTVDVAWSGASDATSGVGGYSYVWDAATATLPDTVPETSGASAASPPLADGGSHYFHLRTHDQAGNWAPNALHLGPFRIDTQAPASPTSLLADPIDWTSTNSFSLTWTNPSDPSGIAGVYYKVGAAPSSPTDGTWVASSSGISGITVPSEGAHTVYVWLQDGAGNASHLNRASTALLYDATAPAAPTSVLVSPSGWSRVNSFGVTWLNPADISGIVGSYHKQDVPPSGPTDGVFSSNADFLSSLTVSGEGVHPLYLWLRDGAGNVDATRRATTTLSYDATPPGSPSALAVSPSTWTATNAFTLTWSNPSDLSGVVGAYRRLNAAPTSPTDGVFVTTTNVLTNVSVPAAGSHTAYVWLRDAAGNADHLAARTATLRYDGEPPTNPAVVTSTSHLVAGWSGNPVVDVSWSGASDAHSGVHGYSYSWDILPSTLPDDTVDTVGDSVSSPVLSDGSSHYFHLRTRDQAGNWSPGAVHLGPFYIDLQAPAAPSNLTAIPPSWSSTNSFTVTWSNPADLSGVSGAYYKIDTPPTSDTDGMLVLGDGLTQISGIALPGQGPHPVYVWLRDKGGNVDRANRSSVTLYLDTLPPGAPTNLTPSPSTWSGANAFTLTWTNPVGGSEIVGAYYKLNAEPTFATDGVFVSTTNTITDIAVPYEGKHDIYLWLKNAAGVVDHATRNVRLQAFWYDKTPPISQNLLSGPMGRNGWYTGTVLTTLSASDNLAGVGEIRHRIDGGAWSPSLVFSVSGDGRRGVDYYATDLAGNIEATRTVTIPIDSTPPTSAVQLSGPLGLGGWYTAPVTVTFAVTDVTSGVDGTHYQVDGSAWGYGLSTVVSGDGVHLLHYASEDQAGNREISRTTSVRIDMTPPQTVYEQSGLAGDSGWFHSDVTVTLSVSETTSGLDRSWYRVDGGAWKQGNAFPVSGQGEHLVEFYSRDLAGNVEPVQQGTVAIDSAAPLPPINIQSDPNTWTRTNAFTVTWTSLADISGIAGAYYKLNAEPLSATDGVFVPAVGDVLTNVTVPDEGSHNLYLWLRDQAGNVNHLTRNIKNGAFLLDVTPPQVEHQVLGKVGQGGWYTEAVNILLSSVDALSGPGSSFYRIGGGEWITGTLFSVTGTARHQVEFYATDRAGNASAVISAEIPIDVTPPNGPLEVQPAPLGWTSINDFSVSWASPDDDSGIVGACYKLGRAPSGPGDGVCVSNPKRIMGIRVPGQGKHDLYLWLKDGAGNQGVPDAVHTPEAFWYDSLPPTTTHTLTGTLGAGDWYVEPVQVALTPQDDGCGVTRTQYRLNWGAWQPGRTFTVVAEGNNLVEYRSQDCMGQWETIRQVYVKVDTQPPQASILSPQQHSSAPIFTLTWGGVDPDPGSGIATYDVQYRDGQTGTWTPFRTAASDTSGTFAGQRGHTYCFRVRAWDQAGNQGQFPPGSDSCVLVDPLANGDFASGDFSFWSTDGPLSKTVSLIPGPTGGQTMAACLGSPDYGPSYDVDPQGVPQVGTVPTGAAFLRQTLEVPSATLVDAPALTLWYHVWTYDTVWSERYQHYYDSFEVRLTDQAGVTLTLALRDGNWDPTLVKAGYPVTDLGWKRAAIDLRPYAGQTIVVELSSWNRNDNYFNTWTCVDDIQVMNISAGTLYLPLAGRGFTGGAGQSAAEGSAPPGGDYSPLR